MLVRQGNFSMKNITVNLNGTCFMHIPASGGGIWNGNPGESILEFPLFRFHDQILLMFFISAAIHFLLRRFHFPVLTSHVLTGMILGSTAKREFFKKNSLLLYPPFPNQVIAQLSKFGFIIYIFLETVRMDTRWVKDSGLQACVIGIIMCAIPRSMVQTIEVKFQKNVPLTSSLAGTSLINTRSFFDAVVNTQFVGVSSTLMQLKITNSRLGRLALASALVSDLLKILINFLLYMWFWKETVSSRLAIQALLSMIIFSFFILFGLRAVMFFFIRTTPEGKPIKDIYTTLVVVTLFILSSTGDAAGSSYIFAPIIFGIVVPAGSPLATGLVTKLNALTTGFLIPILTIYTSSKFNLWDFFAEFSHLLHFQSTLLAYAIKVMATFLTGICFSLPVREAVTLSLILNIKSVYEIGLFISFNNLEVEEIETTSGIFLIFLLASCVPPLIKLLYNPEKQYVGYKKKCIQFAPDNSQLPVVVCAYRREDAMAAIRLLEYSNPTKESPLSIYGLCMEELVGSDIPLLINHQLGQRSSSNTWSRSQPIFEIFKYFEVKNKKTVRVQVFTAISPLKQMHEDVCRLAFDRGSLLIVLPFHKKWNNKGKLVSSSNDLRILNNFVLDRAPCSVGILIDRGRTRGLSSIFETAGQHRVAMLFLGGPDDREALAYALRMAGSIRVQLTVIHFVSSFDSFKDQWETTVDQATLRDMKHQMANSTNITYMEKEMKDGSDTTEIIHSIESSQDLILVGRRHDDEPEALKGLSEWTELPELGLLGDALASSEEACEASILVVQQQILKQGHSTILN